MARVACAALHSARSGIECDWRNTRVLVVLNIGALSQQLRSMAHGQA